MTDQERQRAIKELKILKTHIEHIYSFEEMTSSAILYLMDCAKMLEETICLLS